MPNVKSHEVRRERADLLEQAERITAAALAEGRAMRKDEQSTFDNLVNRAAQLLTQAERIEAEKIRELNLPAAPGY